MKPASEMCDGRSWALKLTTLIWFCTEMNEELTLPNDDILSIIEMYAEERWLTPQWNTTERRSLFYGNKSLEKADSLWLSRKKGERESSSGSGEEREGAKVCLAPVRRGVKEGRTEEWEEREKVRGRLVKSWRKGEEIVKEKGDCVYTQEAEEAYQRWACCRRWARHSRTRRRSSPPGRVVQQEEGWRWMSWVGWTAVPEWKESIRMDDVIKYQISSQCCASPTRIITHNFIDSCEFSSGEFGSGRGSWRRHQGSSCQRGCGSVWYWH